MNCCFCPLGQLCFFFLHYRSTLKEIFHNHILTNVQLFLDIETVTDLSLTFEKHTEVIEIQGEKPQITGNPPSPYSPNPWAELAHFLA